MAKRINRSFADAFSEALEETEEWQSEINLRELVEETFFSIEKAREKKATWEQIAAILQKTIGEEIEVKADTVRQYYFDATAKRAELTKKKRQKAAKNSAKSKPSVPKTAATMSTNQLPLNGVSVADSEHITDDSESSESSFQLRSRKKKEETADG